MLDVHWAFRTAESGAPWRCDPSVDELPETAKLLEAAMAALPPRMARTQKHGVGEGEDILERARLNIIIRRYCPGQKLKWHKDAIGLFEEPIYGLTLHVPDAASWRTRSNPDEGSGCLEFKMGSQRYVVPEAMGLAMLQTGPSRFEWAHGVPSESPGRITVTWRWFRASYVNWMSAQVPEHGIGPPVSLPMTMSTRDRWVSDFLQVATANGIPWSVAEAFLLGLDERRGSAVPWMFRSKNDAVGPQLSADECWRQTQAFWREKETKRLPPPGAELQTRAEQLAWTIRKAGESVKSHGLDPRVMPLLELWELVKPDQDRLEACCHFQQQVVEAVSQVKPCETSGAAEDDDEDSWRGDDAETALMAKMGLPVAFKQADRETAAGEECEEKCDLVLVARTDLHEDSDSSCASRDSKRPRTEDTSGSPSNDSDRGNGPPEFCEC